MSPIESILTRRLGITFIDARTVATEAKLNLGIHGYPTPEEKALLVDEAERIFGLYPARVRYEMLAHRDYLDDMRESAEAAGIAASMMTTMTSMTTSTRSQTALESGTAYSSSRSDVTTSAGRLVPPPSPSASDRYSVSNRSNGTNTSIFGSPITRPRKLRKRGGGTTIFGAFVSSKSSSRY